MFNHTKQNVQTFNNSQFGEIRIALNENQEPLFCLNDVCKALDLKNPRDVKSRLSPRGVAIADTLTQGGVQSMTYINEANLYKCIFQSRKTDAEAFQDWVCEEVLPSIRKSGGYLATKSDDTPEEIMARALTIAQATLAKREERLKQLEADNAMQAETIEAQATELRQAAPKVKYVDNVLQSVNTYTATQIAKEVGMDAAKFHRALKERKVMFYQSGTWMLTAKYQGQGYTKMRTHQFTRNDGSIGTSSYTVFTERGRALMHSIFAK